MKTVLMRLLQVWIQDQRRRCAGDMGRIVAAEPR
jgi:hypothetical protein